MNAERKSYTSMYYLANNFIACNFAMNPFPILTSSSNLVRLSIYSHKNAFYNSVVSYSLKVEINNSSIKNPKFNHIFDIVLHDVYAQSSNYRLNVKTSCLYKFITQPLFEKENKKKLTMIIGFDVNEISSCFNSFKIIAPIAPLYTLYYVEKDLLKQPNEIKLCVHNIDKARFYMDLNTLETYIVNAKPAFSSYKKLANEKLVKTIHLNCQLLADFKAALLNLERSIKISDKGIWK